MKIFELKIDGETEWIWADDTLHALKYYTGLNDVLLSEIDSCDELAKEEWDEYKVTDPDCEYPDQTFAEYVKGLATPEMIASTAY